MKDKSHLTAIRRTKSSAPLMYLLEKGLVKGRVLDFGCGLGKDVETLQSLNYDVEGYDRFYQPIMNPLLHTYDTILCTYVLNVVDQSEREYILAVIKALFHKHTHAYITVRRDIKQRTITSRGTLQDYVVLDYPIITENKNYCIYEITNET